MADLPVHVDVPESLATFARREHIQRCQGVKVLKLWNDLDRYDHIIKATRPEVVVETGSRHGGSALWFAERVPHVVSVDIEANRHRPQRDNITWVTGDAADPGLLARVFALVKHSRTMVSLDSDHTAPHVRLEIGLYGPLVSPGCYLVVEDTIFAHAPEQQLRELTLDPLIDFGTPLDAVEELLVPDPGWERDEEIEALHPTSHHPAGWWVRRA